MELETFYNNFRQLADTPNGIQKLRELILQLAVRGKLVPQDPNDEPASDLLKRINAEKAKLIKEGKIRKPKALPGVTEEEKPFEIPQGWEWVRFSEILDFQGGSQPPKSNFSELQLPGYVRLVQIRDLGPKPQPVYVASDKVTKFCTTTDIMIGRYGASVGKIFWGIDGAYNVALIKIIDNFGVYSRGFLFNLLKSPLGQGFFTGISRSAQGGFNKGDISHSLLPLPPLEEQHRIVTKVDQLMALCDQLEAQQQQRSESVVRFNQSALHNLTQANDSNIFQSHWQRIERNFGLLYGNVENVNQLRQTILQLAVQGKLVPQDPNDEPASFLLERIKKEKAKLIKEGKIRKPTALPGVTDEEKPFEIPKGWAWVRLGDAIDRISSGFSGNQNKEGEGYPMSRIETISDSTVNLNKIGYSTLIPEDKLEYYELHAGDVLLSNINSDYHLGKTAVVPDGITLYHGVNLMLLRTSPNLVAPFIHLILTSLRFSGYFLSIAQHAIGQSSVNQKKIRNILVAISPYNEQHRIVAKIDQLMAVCDELEAHITQSSDDGERLMASITHHLLEAA